MDNARPICLEVCAGEGGSTRGLMDAGWDVIAVDNNPNRLRRNPARWKVLGDAFDAIAAMGKDVDLLWAGWPCQDYSAGTRAARAHGIDTGHKRLIAAGREAMQATGTPWVIENVEGALKELRSPVILCGSMFRLTAIDDDGTPLVMQRHRLFESNIPIPQPLHPRHPAAQVAGSYGGARRDKHEARHVRHGGYVPSAAVQADLMGIDWMTQQGLYLAIPPVYTRYLGARLLKRRRICIYCDREFTTEPVRDLEDVTWRGDQARIYCSQECMVNYAERATSNEPLGRTFDDH